MTVLRLQKAKKTDEGVFKVHIKNDFGESSLTVKVIILGKKPQILL